MTERQVRVRARASNGQTGVRRRDRIAMVIMLLASVGAMVAFAEAALALPDAGANVVLLETWRALGFLVFAGIFLLLALRPRQFPGIWELAFLHKAGLAIVGLILLGGDAVDAGTVALSDGVLAVMIVVAYFLTRGYSSWAQVWQREERHRSAGDAGVVPKRPMVRRGQTLH